MQKLQRLAVLRKIRFLVGLREASLYRPVRYALRAAHRRNTRTFCSVFPNGMLRVVNVERVLETVLAAAQGRLTLSSRRRYHHGK